MWALQAWNLMRIMELNVIKRDQFGAAIAETKKVIVAQEV